MFDELKEVTQFQSFIVIFSLSFHQPSLLSAFRPLDLKRCNMVSNGLCSVVFLQRAISDVSSLGTHAVLLALIDLIFQAAVYCSLHISH